MHDDSEWEIEALNYLQAHLEVLKQEGYHIELAREEQEILITKKK